MSKRCDLTGVGAQTGHKVSHSNHKTKRRFVPNLQNISFLSGILNKKVPLRVTSATLRTVDHNGGLDNYLLTTSNLKLTDIAKRIKRKLKKVLAANEAANPQAEKPAKEVAAKRPAKTKRPAKKAKTQKVSLKKAALKSATSKATKTKTAIAKKAPAKKKAATAK
jgi:large subunit ribosomal protein L28